MDIRIDFSFVYFITFCRHLFCTIFIAKFRAQSIVNFVYLRVNAIFSGWIAVRSDPSEICGE